MTRLRLGPLGAEWANPEPSELSEAVALRRAAGKPLLDLVTANPHEHGLTFPHDELKQIVAEACDRVRVYAPDARGSHPARAAIAGYYAEGGLATNPDSVLLVPGTSMAYYYLFRLLAGPGDEVLVPRPGYPLFDDLAAAAGLGVRNYHLRRGPSGWEFDPEELAFQVTPRTRIVVVVSPHNPLGMVMRPADWRALGDVARRHGLAVVVDEVFGEFVGDGSVPAPRPQAGDLPLVATLNGVSKMLSLPGWKLGWARIEADSSDPCACAAARGLISAWERLADSFLPVTDLAQAMAPALLGPRGTEVRRSLALEYARRRRVLTEALGDSGLDPGAGVYIPVPLAGGVDEAESARRLLDRHGVLVHPGPLYGLEGHLVATAVASEADLVAGGAVIRGEAAIAEGNR